VAYDPSFFARIEASARQSAERVLPLVIDLVEPRSVVDVGCGSGAWLAEAERLGVDDYLGIDGFTPAEALNIPAERFMLRDLAEPLRLDRRFDLVVSLEVAEHLPPEAADVFVESLVSLGPVILFSAAVPEQSGDLHLNEQWPEYWAERFERHGLVAVDAVRPEVWADDEVAWWYRQNALVFAAPEAIERSARLGAARAATRERQLSVVHPILYRWMGHQRDLFAEEVGREPSFREVVRMLPASAAAALRRRTGRARASGEARDQPEPRA
jgi:SAM-dependent methyltransferase